MTADVVEKMVAVEKRPNNNGGYCECGCGGLTPVATRSAKCYGHVKGEPMRFVLGHNNRGRAVKGFRYTVEDRGYVTPCWTWGLGLWEHGYGKVKRYGKQLYAHRLSYEMHVGPIPEGMVIDHLCRNRDCVNPEHLEVVTDALNIQRGSAAKLTWAAVSEMRSQYDAGVGPSELARRFGVAESTAQAVCSGRTWRNTPPPEYAAAAVENIRRKPQAPKLTAEQARELIESSAPVGELAEKYGICFNYAYCLRRGIRRPMYLDAD